MLVEKLDVELDTADGIDASFGDLVLLGFSQRLTFLLLRGERHDQQAEEDGSECAHGGMPPAVLFKHKSRNKE
jgi:hypothetical protein